MTRDIRILSEVINLIEKRWDAVDHKLFFNEKKRELKHALNDIRVQLKVAEMRRANLCSEDDISDEPVAKCLYPEGYTKTETSVPWSGYTAWSHERTGGLDIEAKTSTISRVTWLNDEIIELQLQDPPFKVFATPLNPVLETQRNDEVQQGDIALFVGQYLALGVHDEDQYEGTADAGSSPLLMTNYLRITSMEEQVQSRRGQNRGRNKEVRMRVSFK